MADDNQSVDLAKTRSDATVSGDAALGTIDSSAKNAGIIDGISKADRWKSYLDTRKQYVECEFRTSQDFDKIMLTWPAALIAGSLTIFWHVDGTVYWMSYLYAGWFFEFLALALMLGSMVTRQLLYRHLIAKHDDGYQAYLASEVNVPPDNPWKEKTQLAEWFSIAALIIGAVFVFAFSIGNAPSSSAPPGNSAPSSGSAPPSNSAPSSDSAPSNSAPSSGATIKPPKPVKSESSHASGPIHSELTEPASAPTAQ